MLFTWLRTLAKGKSRKSSHRTRRCSRERKPRCVYRPELEQLEIRLAPATFTWTGTGITQNWSDAGNWGGAAPSGAATDDLVFPVAPAGSFVSNNDIVGGTFDSITFGQGGYLITGNALTLNPTTNTGTVGINNTGTNVFQPNLTLTAPQTFTSSSGTLLATGTLAEGTNALTITGAGNVTLTGIVSGTVAGNSTALVKGTSAADTGILTLTANNTYSGQTLLNDGIINVQATTALGGTTAGNGTLIAAGATLQMQGGIGELETIPSLAVNATIESVSGINTLSGAITLTTPGGGGNVNLIVDVNQLSISGAITDGGNGLGLSKSGVGTLVLTNNLNTYGGLTNINAGVVSITAANALGSTAAGTVVATGASLQLSPGAGTTFAAEPLNLSGSGFNSTGALINAAQANTFSGNITLSAAATINTTTSLTVTGTISSNGTITNNLAKVGAGPLILQGNNTGFTANVFIGNETAFIGSAAAGQVTLSGANGALNAAAGFIINPGGTLLLDNSASNNTDRLADGAPITLNGGSLSFTGSAAGSSETVGNVTLNTGASTITSTSAAGGNTLSIANLTRNAGATVIFVGATSALGTATNQIIINGNINGASPTAALVNSILPWALVGTTATNASNFATYTTGSPGGITALAAGSYNTSLANLTTGGNQHTQNYKLTNPGNFTIPAGTIINSLIVIDTTATMTVTLAGSFTIGDATVSGAVGAFLVSGTSTQAVNVTGGTLSFANEGIIDVGTTVAALATNISSPIVGTAGLTVSPFATAASQLTLSSATGNTFSGPVTLDSPGTIGNGVLSIATGADLGTGILVLTNGTLQATATAQINNPVSLGGTVTFGSTSALTFHGPVTLTSNSTITNSDTGGVVFFGAIGDGGNGYTLSLAGAQALTLNDASTYSGGTVLANTGTLTVGHSSALGTGNVTVQATAPTFTSNVGVALANPFTLAGANTVLIITGTNPIAFTSPLTLRGANGLTVLNTGGVTFSTITGGGSLALSGTGVAFLPNANTYAGATVITSTGTVVVGNSTSFGSGPLTLTGGAAATTTILTATAPVTFNNPLTLKPLNTTGSFTFTGAAMTFTGLATLSNTAASILTFNNATTFAGPISGSATTGLTLQGTGTVTFSGPNTFTNTAGLTLNMTFNGFTGTLALGHNRALGAVANLLTVTAGNIQASGANPISLANPLTFTANAPVSITGSQGLTFTGNVTLNTANILTVTNTAPTIFAGAIGGGAATFTLAGSSTSLVNLTGNSTYTGNTTINGGILSLNSANGGNGILASANFTVNNGGTLMLDNSFGNNNTRIPSTAALTLNGGNFTITGNTTAATTESIAAITLGAGSTGGAATINALPGTGGNVTLNVTGNPGLIRAAGSGATVNFNDGANGTNLGNSAFLTFANAPTLTGTPQPGGTGLLPYATVTTAAGLELATYSGTTIEPYSAVGAAYAASVTAANPGDNVNYSTLNASDTVTGNTTINSLTFSGSGNASLTINPGVVVTVTSGGLLTTNNTAVNITGGGTLVLGAEAVVITAGGSSINLNTPINAAGTGNLTLSGGGTVTLDAVNNFGAGSTALNGGTTLVLGMNSFNGAVDPAVGTGTLILSNGTIQTTIASGLTLANALALPNSTVTLGGNGNPLTFSGNATASGSTVTLNTPTAADLALFTGVESGAVNLVKNGPGTLFLTAGNAYALVTITGGIVNAQNATALGAATSAAVVASGATLQLENSGASITFTKPLVLNGPGAPSTSGVLQTPGGGNGINSLSGNIVLQTDATLGVDTGSLILSGIISGPAGLIKAGNGFLSLGGTNTFVGGVSINAGILEMTVVGALGSIVGGATVASGATLHLNTATGTIAGEALTINGNGFGNLPSGGFLTPRGALVNVTNATTWTGNINLLGDTTVSALASTLTVSGIISGNASLTKVGAGNLTLTAGNTFTNNLTVTAGNVTLQQVNAYSGNTTVGTTAELTLSGLGTILNTMSPIVVSAAATLLLDNSVGANVGNRIADTTGITLNGGGLSFTGSNNLGFTTSETVGPITLGAGSSVITSTSGNSTGDANLFTSNSLARNAGATVSFVGANTNLGTASNQFVFTVTPPQLVTVNGGTILPFATVTGSSGLDIASYSAANPGGITAFANYTPSINGANSNGLDVVKLGLSETLTGNKTIAALLLPGGFTETLNNNFTLNVGVAGTQGLVVAAGASNTLTAGGTLAFGSAEGILISVNPTTINSPLTGSGGLTIAGSATLQATDSITGPTFLTAGTVSLGTASALSSGTLTITGVVTLQAINALAVGNPLALTNASLTFGTTAPGINAPITFSGNATLTGEDTLTLFNTGGITFSGQLSGTGQLVVASFGTLFLTNPAANNSFSGGALVGGTVVVGDGNALGNGTLGFSGAVLVASGPALFTNSYLIGAATTFSSTTAANTITLSGTGTLTANVTVMASALGTTTLSGNLTEAGGARSLTVNGLGTLALTGVNSYAGGTVLNNLTAGVGSGILSVGSGQALGTGNITLISGVLSASGPATFSNFVAIGAGPLVFSGNALTFGNLLPNAIVLTANSTILVNNSTTFNGIVSGGGFGLVLSGAPIVAGGAILNPTGMLTMTANNTFSGSVVVSGGTLKLSGDGALPGIAASPALTVNLGGNLTLDNTAFNNTNRLQDFGSLILNGGTFTFLGTNMAGTNSSETLGALNVKSGSSLISSSLGAGGNTAVSFGTFARVAGATVNFQAGPTGNQTFAPGTNQVTYTNNPASAGIIPGAAVIDAATISNGGPAVTSSVKLANSTAAGANFAIVAQTSYAALSTTGTNLATDNALVTGNLTLTANDTVNSVLIIGDAITVGGAVTLNTTRVASSGGTGTGDTVATARLALGGTEGILLTNNGTLAVNSLITGTAGVTIAGAGTLSLPNPNLTAAGSASYTGTTTVDGSVNLGGNNAIPGSSGSLTLTIGTITANAPLLIPNTISFGNLATETITSITLAGSPIVFSGNAALPVLLAGDNATFTVNNTTTFTGIISGGTLTKLGGGTLALAGANTYTGVTTIGAGIVIDQASAGLGASAAGQGTIVVSGATLQVQQITNAALAIAEPLSLNGTGTSGALEMLPGGTSINTISGAIALLGDTQVSADAGQLTLSGIISGAAGLSKAGNGVLSLSGNNTYTGLTSINAGILEANANLALGAITAGTVVANATSLQLNPTAAATYAGEQLTLNGPGFGTLPNGGIAGLLLPRGSLDALANFAITWTGNILLNTPSTLSNQQNTLTVNGIVSGADLTKVGGGTVLLTAAATFGPTLTVSAGSLTLANSNSYAGNTTVSTTAALTLNGFGTALNSTGFTVGVGATLSLDNQNNGAINLLNRIGDSAGITLTGASLNFIGNNNPLVVSSETFGNLTLAGGSSTITNTAGTGGGSAAFLTSSQLVRASGATVNFVGATAPLGSSLNQIVFTSSASVTALLQGSNGGILPFALVNSGDFTTYSIASGVAPFAGYAASLAAAGPTDTVKLTANEALTGNKTINAVLIASTATVGEAGFTLNVTSGAVATTVGPSTLIGGTVAFGSTEGIIQTVTGQTTTVNAMITGSGGLTVSGTGGTLNLPNPNAYTGTTSLDSGILSLGSGSAISPNNLVLVSGTLQGSAGLNLANNFALNDSAITFSGTVPITFTGNGTLSGNSTLTVSNTGGTYLNGQLTGGGGLILAGAATNVLFLTNVAGNNTYTAGTLLNGPTVVVGDSNALGSSNTLGLTAGTLVATTGVTLGQTIILNGAATFTGSTAGSGFTLGGTTTLTANTTLTVSAGTTFTGNVGEAGGARVLTVNGLGTLALNGVNSYAGGTVLNDFTAGVGSGMVNVSNGSGPGGSSSLGSGGLTLTSGALNNASGGNLTFNNAISTAANPVAFTGSGLTFNGLVALTANATFLLNNTITFNGVVSGTANLTLSSTPIIAGTSTNVIGATGNLTLTAANTFTGNTTVSGGTLALAGLGSVASTGLTAVTVNVSGTLKLDNSTVYVPNRLTGAAVTVVLNGGTLAYVGSNTASVTANQTIAAVSLASGNSMISSTQGAGTAALTISTLTRSSGATAVFAGTDAALILGGNNQIRVSTLGAGAASSIVNNGNILAYATVTGPGGAFDFATYGSPAITAFSGYSAATNINSVNGNGLDVFQAVTGDNLTLTGNVTVAGFLFRNDSLTANGAFALTLGAGALATTGAAAGDAISTTTLALGAAEGVVATNTNSILTINATIAGLFGLTIAGGGTLSLPNANSYSGTTTLDGGNATNVSGNSVTSTGTLILGTNNSVTGGNLNLTNGNIQASTPITLTTTPFLTFAPVSAITFSGSNPIILSGASVLLAAAGGTDTLTVANSGGTTIQGAISGAAALTKLGTGTLVLTDTTGAASSYTGVTNVFGGIVNTQSGSGLGTTSGAVVAGGATLQLQGGITLARPLTLNGTGVAGNGALESLSGANTESSTVVLNGSSTVGVDVGSLTMSNIISGAFALTKTGSGTLTLSNANTYLGPTNITAGIVSVVNASALGSIVSGAVVSGGATLAVTVAGPFAEPLTLNGTGFGLNQSGLLLPIGALEATTVNSTWSGNIELASDSSISAAGFNLTVTGIISGPGGLTKVGASSLFLQAANTYSGNTTVAAGVLSLNTSGTALNAPNFTVNQGATLQLDNTATNLLNRVGTTANVTLNGGFFTFLGSNTFSTASSESLGTITLNAGYSTITSTTGTGVGSTDTITSANLVRNVGATASFVAGGTFGQNPSLGTAGNQLVFTAINGASPASQLVNGILPWATVTSVGVTALDFATYGSNGIAAYANYKTSLASAGPTDNVRLTSSEALATNKTVNSLLIVGSVTVTQNLFTLIVGSGGVVATGAGTPIIGANGNGTIDFGSAEGILLANVNATITSAITGSDGLTISGAGNVTLPGANFYTGTTTYNGGTALNTGNLSVSNVSSLSNGPLAITNGGFGDTVGGQFAIGNALTLTNSVATLGNANNLTLTGPITVTGNNQITSSGTANIVTYIGGPIGGTGSLNILTPAAASFLTLEGANTYSGGTNLGGGTLVVTNSSQLSGSTIISGSLGTGPVNLTGGTITAALAPIQLSTVSTPGVAAASFANPITLINGSATITGVFGTSLAFTGNVTVAGNTNTLTNTHTGMPTGTGLVSPGVFFSGLISGSGALTFAGAGLTELSGANTYTGGTSVTAGTVVVGSNSALGSGLLTIAGGTLQDDGNSAYTIANPVVLGAGTQTINATNPAFNLTLTGTVGGTGALFKGSTSLAGANPSNSAGTLVLTAAETYTGNTTVNQGTLDHNGNGTAITSSAFIVNSGATLLLDNSAGTNNANRIGDTAPLTLAGGTFNYVSAGNAVSTETLGNLTISAGSSTINPTATGAGATIVSFGTYTRLGGGTVNFVAGSGGTQTLGTNDLITFTANSTVNNVMRGATVTDAAAGGFNLVTSTGAAPFSISALPTASYAAFVPGGNLGTDNVLITGNAALTAPNSPNAVLIRGDGITISGGFNFTPSTGMFAIDDTGNSGNTFTTTVPNAGAADLEFILANSAGATGVTTVSSIIPAATTGGLTVGGNGSGTLVLGAANLYTGTTNLTAGTVQINANTSFAATSVTFTVGTLQSGGTVTATNLISLAASTTPVTIGGALNLTLTGVISGSGSLIKNGTGTLAFAGLGANTYTGITTVSAGSLTVGSAAVNVNALAGQLVIGAGGLVTIGTTATEANVLGNANVNLIVNTGAALSMAQGTTLGGNLILNGGNIIGTGALTLSNNVTVLPNATTLASISAPLTLGGANAMRDINVAAGGPNGVALDISGVLGQTGAAGYHKLGAGLLQLSGAVSNTVAGTVTVNEGTLALNKSAVAIVGPLVIGDFNGSDLVKVVSNTQQFTANQTVVLNGSGAGGGSIGTLDISLSTAAQTPGALQIDGGMVNLGNNSLTLGSDVTAVASGGQTGVIQATPGTTGNLTLGATRNFFVADSGGVPGLSVNAIITGAGFGITKQGAGTLLLSPQAANSYTGSTTVNAGTLVAGGPAVTIPGNVVVGDFIAGANYGPTSKLDLLQLAASNQIVSTATVTINNTGWLDLNGFTNTISTLAMTSGSVTTETGTLTLAGNVFSLASPLDFNPATISGNVNLNGAVVTADVQLGALPGVSPANSDLAISAVISNGGLVKQDTGKLQLTGNNTYTGPTTINGGTVLVDGPGVMAAGGSVTVNSSGTLGGNLGSINSPITVNGGTVSPGDSPGTLNGISADFSGIANPSNTLLILVQGLTGAGTNYSQLNLSGNLTLGGNSTLSVNLAGFGTTTGIVHGVVIYGGLAGTFSSVTVSNNPNYFTVTPNYGTIDPNEIDLVIAPAATAATHFTVSAPTSATAGTAFNFTVSAQDQFNNLVSGYGGTVHFTSSDGTAALPPNSTLTSGTGSFSATLGTAGSQTLTATDTANSSITGTSNPIAVGAAAATHYTVSAPSSAIAGTAFNFTLTAQDAYNNAATSYGGTVTFSSSDGAATLPANSTLTNGTGTFSATLNTSGSQTITATDTVTSSITGTSNVIATTGLIVTAFTATPRGFTASFSQPFVNGNGNLPIHLYDAASANYGPADVILFNQTANATIRGSLVINSTNTGFTFVETNEGNNAATGASNGLLPAGTYTATFVSGPSAFQSTTGEPLDGKNSVGNTNSNPANNNYVATFTVAANTAVVVSIPDFARGPDAVDLINVPNNASPVLGIPIALSNGNGVTSANVTIEYDATLLTITGNGTVNPNLTGASMSVVYSGSGNASFATITFQSPTPLAAGNVQLGGLTATVPTSAPYQSKELLHFSSLSLNNGGITVTNDDAVHIVAFLGDTSGDGNYTGQDATLLSRVAAHADSGFAAYPQLDPLIIGDINGDGAINNTDGIRLNQFLAGNNSQNLFPNYPGPPSVGPTGPDPSLSIPANLLASAGGTVTVPVNIDDPHPAGSTGVTQATLALQFDPKEFTVSAADIHLGSVPASGTGWQLQTRVDDATGQIGIILFSAFPISSSDGGSLITINFHVQPGATPGATPISLVAAVNPNGQGVVGTGLDDDHGPLTLHFAPSDPGSAVGGATWIIGMTGASPVGSPAAGPVPALVEAASNSGSGLEATEAAWLSGLAAGESTSGIPSDGAEVVGQPPTSAAPVDIGIGAPPWPIQSPAEPERANALAEGRPAAGWPDEIAAVFQAAVDAYFAQAMRDTGPDGPAAGDTGWTA